MNPHVDPLWGWEKSKGNQMKIFVDQPPEHPTVEDVDFIRNMQKRDQLAKERFQRLLDIYEDFKSRPHASPLKVQSAYRQLREYAEEHPYFLGLLPEPPRVYKRKPKS